MDNILKAAIIRFAQLALDDDHGVSDAAMNALVDLKLQADKVDPDLSHHLAELIRGTDCTMVRRYTAK